MGEYLLWLEDLQRHRQPALYFFEEEEGADSGTHLVCDWNGTPTDINEIDVDVLCMLKSREVLTDKQSDIGVHRQDVVESASTIDSGICLTPPSAPELECLLNSTNGAARTSTSKATSATSSTASSVNSPSTSAEESLTNGKASSKNSMTTTMTSSNGHVHTKKTSGGINSHARPTSATKRPLEPAERLKNQFCHEINGLTARGDILEDVNRRIPQQGVLIGSVPVDFLTSSPIPGGALRRVINNIQRRAQHP